jgi:HD-GYP domain-containing protein (c-di-GMP phosphodiesterase class II)
VACKALAVGRVIARVSLGDPEIRANAGEAVLAALVYEAGMLSVPPEVLFHSGPLDESQRRRIEAHAHQGAELLRRAHPDCPEWLVEAVAEHHERLDGSGYPAGLREGRLPPLARLLAVCDLYMALASPRPWRAALDTRRALVETLRLAEQGVLDPAFATRLLERGFYPVGTAVELADGSLGVVVGTRLGHHDARTPGRPIVALLTDPEGEPLPHPRHVDLEKTDRAIFRALPPTERRERLGQHHPDWAS